VGYAGISVKQALGQISFEEAMSFVVLSQ